MRNYQRGQALLELSIVLGSTGVLLLLLIPELYQPLQARYKDAQRMQIELAEAPWREYFRLQERSDSWWQRRSLWNSSTRTRQLGKDAEYPFAKSIAPVWSILERQSEFSLPLNTAYTAQLSGLDTDDSPNDLDYLRFRRIHDDWSPQHRDHLANRPRSLTATAALQDLGFHYVQQVVGWLPFAREFSPSQLKLGHIDTSVVPLQRTCREGAC